MLHHIRRVDARQILAAEVDAALARAEQSGDRVQRGGFARAVCADQRDDLALIHREGNALDCVNRAVINVDIVDFQQTHAFASFCLPRYASMTTGLFWISSAVPLAIMRP